MPLSNYLEILSFLIFKLSFVQDMGNAVKFISWIHIVPRESFSLRSC